jgi:hypothetical protein
MRRMDQCGVHVRTAALRHSKSISSAVRLMYVTTVMVSFEASSKEWHAKYSTRGNETTGS